MELAVESKLIVKCCPQAVKFWRQPEVSIWRPVDETQQSAIFLQEVYWNKQPVMLIVQLDAIIDENAFKWLKNSSQTLSGGKQRGTVSSSLHTDPRFSSYFHSLQWSRSISGCSSQILNLRHDLLSSFPLHYTWFL